MSMTQESQVNCWKRGQLPLAEGGSQEDPQAEIPIPGKRNLN